MLSWTRDTTGLNYSLLRSEDGGVFHEIVRLDHATSTYIDRSSRGNTLTYQIVTHNYYGDAPPARSEAIVRQLFLSPKGVTQAVATTLPNGNVRLTWTADPTAIVYRIMKSGGGGPFVQVVELSSTQSLYQDRNPQGQKSTYQIISMNHSGQSPPVSFAEESAEIITGTDSAGPVTKP